MEASKITSYIDAVTKEKGQLADLISSGLGAIVIPADKASMQVGKSNFLTKSGWVYNVVGVIAFVVGLIVAVPGIWITGLTAVTAGVYCLIKGKQQLEAEAYDKVGDSIITGVDGVVAKVSKSWTDFVLAQNAALRKDVVTSASDTDTKVKALGMILDNAWYRVDIDGIKKDISTVDAGENLSGYKAYLAKTEEELNKSLELAVKAQTDIYEAMPKDVAAQSAKPVASATQSATQSAKPAEK